VSADKEMSVDEYGQGSLLAHDTPDDATAECIAAVGGIKAAALLLRPELEIEQGARWLRDCLNPRKRDKLDVRQYLVLWRSARERGCLAGVAYVNDYCDCAPPIPISPEDEEAELQREFIRAEEGMRALVDRMEQIAKRRALTRVPGRAA